MSLPDPAFADDPLPEVAAEELAARLAAKLCHDFISPAGAIIAGLDLLDDPSAKDMRDEAMDLIASSARKLTDLLAFARVAFGASAGAESFDSAELERLTAGVYAHVRADLDWAVAPPQAMPKAAARVLLNLAQLAAAALPTGGVARIEATPSAAGWTLTATATGPRARLHPEVQAGLAGEPLGEGLAGRWVQAYYAYAITRGAGGRLNSLADEARVALRAVVP
jgi:histidine phosphotransferase ChpT